MRPPRPTQPISGFLVIDKSSDWTSHDVVQKARNLLNIKKIGHLGTLDPLATGVLVLAVGQATKIIEYLMGCDKEYVAEVTLGAESTTYDAEGAITEISSEQIFREQVESALKNFVGEIDQVPPAFSAIKIDGQKAYEKARKGESVELKSRKVTIHSLELADYSWPKLTIHIHCGSGTYIRSLAHDLGKYLKCGGYLSALERTRVGKFTLENSVDIESVSEENLLPLEAGLPDFLQVNLDEAELEHLQDGQFIAAKESLSSDQTLLGMRDARLAGILAYEAKSGLIKPKKMIVTK